MVEITIATIKTIGSFAIGLLVGSFLGWIARSYYEKDKLKKGKVTRFALGFVIMSVWTTAAYASIFGSFSIPIYFHVFAGLVTVPIVDPEGNTIDKILSIIPSK